ncbi:MarR family winged helix-turn-helix transcriptional regulator [Sphingomonas sp. G-3-2-10]|jgi:DNA-binding MarR family transcriptional regulator|uniref:MarR family winged helix-turn-helix transcriptional regulator n=1 Tax=Sphingomonas sp. G-3-2-10 TaxID=2728838 RepID=UPI0019D20137|nr:MarR family winged helix-turn-helix transcriptional regulator [Sphingomonas sp. G-3-2-10]
MTETLGFVLKDLSHVMRRAFDARARAIGVTRAQWQTLFVLSRNEGSNQGTLAELLDVEPITLCRMVDRLEEAGLVERRRDPADRRAWLIYLTPASHPMVAQLRELGDALNEEALDGIDDAEREQLTATLAKVRANLARTTTDMNETANG